MTGSPPLDWALLALSLFNTILLLWLGLTVLLTAERHVWALWLAGGGLLAGGLVFISHSAMLILSPTVAGRGLDFWWRAAWAPILLLPGGWYLLMLWYAGFWDGSERSQPGRLRTRQWPWLLLAPLCLALLAGLALFTSGLPAFDSLIQPGAGGQLAYLAWPGSATPWLLFIYPVYAVLCISLSLDAVLRPDPTARWMGDLARQRARPWFVAASIALLAASLFVAAGMIWLALLRHASWPFAPAMGWFDLLVAGLIGLAVVALGQAIVVYEVFTGKPLPRHGFRRYWRNAVILAAGYGAAVSGSTVLHLHAAYGVLISTMLLVVFYALLSWRSVAERELSMQRLRPFVAGRHFTDHLMPGDDTAPAGVAAQEPFWALCGDVLGAGLAYLIPLGPLAPLAGPPLSYPGGVAYSWENSWLNDEVSDWLNSQAAVCRAVQPAQAGGAEWAVPLWSERSLIGALLLGPKRDGGLYSQEEIEVARATGERLLDNLAGAELARRLIALQRQRLAESQVLDGRARRKLHDDVLPHLHAAMLALSAAPDAGGGEATEAAEALALLATVHRQLSDLLHEMPAPAEPLLARLGLAGALREVTDHELAGAFDEVAWQVAPDSEGVIQALPPLVAEVVFCAAREAIRNAARHGRCTQAGAPLHLRIRVTAAGELNVMVEDDGVGFAAPANASCDDDPAAQSRGADRDTPGERQQARGHGLAMHATMMTVIGGSLEVESHLNSFTRVLLRLPIANGRSMAL